MFYRGLYSYRQRLRVITLFPNIFSYCFCLLREFAEGFEKKVSLVEVANLHNATRALSSLSRCVVTTQNCCLYIIIKIALQAESEACFQIWFFPRLGGKNGGVLGMRMKVILGSLFARLGSDPIWGGKKGEFRDWTKELCALSDE